jgi:HD superfamily phosphohydrolase
MPKWGVTAEDLAFGDPWGLPRDLLEPAKTVTDPVHGDVYINELERRLLDSPSMQRLRRVRQLGTTHLVYPGATHSRFSHALGTLRAAQDLLDAVADNRRSPGHVPDLLDEWDASGVAGELPRRFAEATVLARLGGLLHDLCHVPLGHTIEDDLKVLEPHDSNVPRFERMWSQLDPTAREAIEAAGDLKNELKHLIMSKIDMPTGWTSQYPFVEDIVGNTICADLMDYLSRDHHHAGLPMEIGHRFLDHFYVMPSNHVRHAQKMIIRTTRNGQQRQDIRTELEKYLRYRYELTERVLTHHAKTSADAMIGKLLEMWSDATWLARAADKHPDEVAHAHEQPLDAVKKKIALLSNGETVERPDGRNKDGSPRTRQVPKTVDEIDMLVRDVLEREFTSRSDDGLLEHLAFEADRSSGERWQGIGALASAVLDRRLFKRAARADSAEDLAEAATTYRQFGSADQRRRLELDAARFAGVNPGWKIVIWLPEPTMRLKVAEVLVDSGKGVAALDSLSGPSKQIVQSHKELWAVTIYVEPELALGDAPGVDAMLAYLRDELDLALHDSTGKAVRGLRELARDVVAEALNLTGGKVTTLEDRMQLVSAAAGGGTFDALIASTWETAREAGLTDKPLPNGSWKRWAPSRL